MAQIDSKIITLADSDQTLGTTSDSSGGSDIANNRLLSLDDLRQMPRPRPLIEGVLYSDMEHVLFGRQGISKTFLLLDWILHMAHGRNWMGKQTQWGRSLLVCGEGGGRVLADRIYAWLKYNEVPDDAAANDCIRITEFPVPMLDKRSVNELLKMIKDETTNGGFDLIAFDTLMANFGSGDENQQKDMAAFLAAFRYVRLETGAGVLCVHHTPHSDTTRPQGANALRRNVDIELRVDRDPKDQNLFGLIGGGELKARHGNGLGLISYKLEVTDIGETDENGEAVTSCVIGPTKKKPKLAGNSARGSRLGKNQRNVQRIIEELAKKTDQDLDSPEGVFIADEDFLRAYKAADLKKQQIHSVKSAFREKGWLTDAQGGFIWLPLQRGN